MLSSFRSACSAEAEVCSGQLNFIFKENSLEINHVKSKFCNNFLKDRTCENKKSICYSEIIVFFVCKKRKKDAMEILTKKSKQQQNFLKRVKPFYSEKRVSKEKITLIQNDKCIFLYVLTMHFYNDNKISHNSKWDTKKKLNCSETVALK